MKKYYHIFSRGVLLVSTIYLVSGILSLTVISKNIIIDIFIVNIILEGIRLFLFKSSSINYEKKKIPPTLVYLNGIFCVLAVYFDMFFLKIIALALYSVIIIITIKDEYLKIK